MCCSHKMEKEAEKAIELLEQARKYFKEPSAYNAYYGIIMNILKNKTYYGTDDLIQIQQKFKKYIKENEP